MVVDEKGSDADAYTEADERGRHDAPGWSDIDDGWVVLRHINYLRIGGLNRVYGLTRGLLDINLLLRVAAQGSGGVGLRAETLDGRSYFRLIGCDSLTDCGVVVDMFGHHLEHCRKGD
jgi:hypothetical protein